MPITIMQTKKDIGMIKSYSNTTTTSYSVNFIYKASKKRRMIALDNARIVQNEFGIAPRLKAVK